MEALGVFYKNAGRELIVTGTLVKVPAPSSPTFPVIEPPPFTPLAGPDPGFSPQLVQDYNRRRASYEDAVKAWKLLDNMIREALRPGYPRLPMIKGLVPPHNDYAINVESVKLADK
jgi:hypothetical protein